MYDFTKIVKIASKISKIDFPKNLQVFAKNQEFVEVIEILNFHP